MMNYTRTTPHRIRRQRTPGWRMPENARYVGRGTAFGNPWRIIPVTDHHFPFGDAADVVHMTTGSHLGRFERYTLSPGTGAPYWASQGYRLYLRESPGLLDLAIAQLRGRDLACWCREDQPCHGDVLLDLVNGEDRG